MRIVYKICLALLIIGGLNWGLIGLFQYDLVADLFGGQDSSLARLIYSAVGIAALISIIYLFMPDARNERETDPRYNRYTTPNMNTEFGEEVDFSKEKEFRKNK